MKKNNQLLWLLPLVILSIAQCSQETIEMYHDTEYYRSAETVHVENDFDGSSVLVVLDKKTGGINKSHKMSFFGSFEMEYVKDLTEISGDIDSKGYLNKEEFHQILKIKLPKDSKENVLNIIRQLERVEGILYACPNYYLYPAATPNDPEFKSGNQWGLNGTYGVKAPAAWDITIGAKGILVGIIDSGISSHEDLNDNLLSGFNFVNYNSNTMDTVGHGTQVAGIVGAVGNNDKGMAGICWDVSLVPLHVDDPNNNSGALVDRIVQAISFAISTDIGILNCSKEMPDLPSYQILYQAINNYSGLFVIAAGNAGVNINTHPLFISIRQLNNVIIVGAMNNSGNRWVGTYSGSNYGNQTVHLFAPGENILNTHLGDNYDYDPGTSFAAPHVTGAAALIKSVYPHLTTAQIKTIILNNVTKDTAKLGNYCTTGGRLNVEATLKSQGTVIGYFDIKFNNPNWINSGVIGRFYLFNNGKWSFVERGFYDYSRNLSNNFNIAGFLQTNPVPATITNNLAGRTLNTTLEVMIPAYDARLFGNHHTGITVGFMLSGSTVTFSHISNTNRPIGADVLYNNIFKITNKQGNL